MMAMKFVLEMACDNAAFDEDLPGEVARILRHHADGIARHALMAGDTGRVMDGNGNTVGTWRYTE